MACPEELPLEKLSDHLSELADLVLCEVMRITWHGLRTRHCEEPCFAIIAYGKLGGKELGYGLGVWLHASGILELHGYDAGVSYRSMHDPASASTWTVGSNTSDGSWPMETLLVADLPH